MVRLEQRKAGGTLLKGILKMHWTLGGCEDGEGKTKHAESRKFEIALLKQGTVTHQIFMRYNAHSGELQESPQHRS